MLLQEKAAKQESNSKALVIGKNVIQELQDLKLDGKNLFAIDTALDGKLVDIKKIVTQMASGDQITNVGLEFKDRVILISTSKGFDHAVWEDDRLFKSTLYIRPTARLNPDGTVADKEGEYTGPLTCVFGMPGELNVVENISVLTAVEVK